MTDPDDRHKHLEFVQAVIARLATTSTLVKGWTLTVALVAFGFSSSKTDVLVAVLGLVGVVVFALSNDHNLWMAPGEVT